MAKPNMSVRVRKAGAIFSKHAYPATGHRTEGDDVALELMGQGGFDTSGVQNRPNLVAGATGSSEASKIKYVLPDERENRYQIYEQMAGDPTISNALEMHVTNALTPKTETGEIISIESSGDEDNPIVVDLRDSLKGIINRKCAELAYEAAKLGISFLRIYSNSQRGVHASKSDFYTHPRYMKIYEKGGELVGFTNSYQLDAAHGRVKLIPPWKFIPVKIPWRQTYSFMSEPVRTDWGDFNIAADEPFAENVIEASNYGKSFLESAYVPWMDLQNSLTSLKQSRTNASRLERFMGVRTGNLAPDKAAAYLNDVSGRLTKTQTIHTNRLIAQGYSQTVINHLLPIWGEKGGIDFNTLEGKADIAHIEDIMFHVKRLGGALGVDPSLLGFGDMLSGGLGDGGFFRISILAANRSNILRLAVRAFLEEMAVIHCAIKHNKYFLPGQRPWKFVFHAISSAVENEYRSNMQSRVEFGTALATLAQTVDPEGTKFGDGFINYIFTEICQINEEEFKTFLAEKGLPDPNNVNPEDEGMQDIMESTDTRDVVELIRDAMQSQKTK